MPEFTNKQALAALERAERRQTANRSVTPLKCLTESRLSDTAGTGCLLGAEVKLKVTEFAAKDMADGLGSEIPRDK